MAKEKFSDATVVVGKTRKTGYIYVFGTWIAILSFIYSRPLHFAPDVICPWLPGIS